MKKIKRSFSRTNSEELLAIESEKERLRKNLLAVNNNIEVNDQNILNNHVVIYDNEAYSLAKMLQFADINLNPSEVTEEYKPSIWQKVKSKIYNKTANMAIFGKCGNNDTDTSSSDLSEMELDRERKRRFTPILKKDSQNGSVGEVDQFGLPVYQGKSQSEPSGYTHINLGTERERALRKGPKVYNINKESDYRVNKLFSNMKINDTKAYIRDFHNFEHKNERKEPNQHEEKREGESENKNEYTPTAPYNEDYANFLQENHQKEIESMMRKYETLQKESNEIQQRMNTQLNETRKEVEYLKSQVQDKERENKRILEQEREREEQSQFRENLKRTADFSKEKSRYMRNKFKRTFRGKEDYAQFDYGSGMTSGESSDEFTEKRSFIERKGFNKKQNAKNEFITREDFERELKKLRSNKNSNEITVDFDIDLEKGSKVAEGYIALIISTLKKTGIFMLRKGGNFHSFIDQFNIENFAELNQIEFNVVLTAFLDEEIITYLQKHDMNPRKLDTNTYLSEIQRVTNNDIFSINDIELQLRNKHPKNNKPLDYLLEIIGLVDIISTSQVPETQKISMIWQNYRKIFSIPVQMQMENHCNSLDPGLRNFKEGLRNFVRHHHGNLAQDMLKSVNMKKVNMVDIHQNAGENIASNNDKYNNSKNVDHNKSSGSGGDSSNNKNNNNHNNNNNQNHNNNNNQNNQNKNKNQREIRKRYPPKQEIFCDQCFQPNHRGSRCIYNNDLTIANENQKRMGYCYCIKCFSLDHLSIDCPVYPNIAAVKFDCIYCDRQGMGKRKHPAEHCVYRNTSHLN